MALRLDHYVFSSLGGYRTVYASDGMPRRLVSALEALAKSIYRDAQARELSAWLRPDDATICVVKAFQNGTDHAGRRRSCVHAVVFSAGDAAGSWFFTPFLLPDSVFLSTESPLQSLANELPTEVSLKASAPPRPSSGCGRDCRQALLSLMLSPAARVAVTDRTGEALSCVRSLSWALPPTVRSHLTLSAGFVLPEVEGLGGARMAILPPQAKPAEDLAGHVVIDFPGGDAGPRTDSNRGVPFNVYAKFVAANLGSEEGHRRVKKLVELLERHPPSLDLTQERYRRLLEGFAKVEATVERGVIDVRRDPVRGLSAVRDFALAGMHSTALDILDSVVSFLLERYDVDAESMRAALSRLRSGEAGDERRGEALSFLAERLVELLETSAQMDGGSA